MEIFFLHFQRHDYVLNEAGGFAVMNASPSYYVVKFLIILAISTGLLTASQAVEKPSFHTKGTPTGKPTASLKPGE
jgi:hypothetical protein